MATHSVFLLDKRVGRNSHWDRMEMKQRGGEVRARMPREDTWGVWKAGSSIARRSRCEVRGVDGSAREVLNA